MTISLMEGAVDAVRDYLSTNLGAMLDTIDAEYDDGTVLADIQAYYKGETLAVPELPAIYVLGNRTLLPADGPTHVTGAHHMTVAILCGGADTEALRKRLYRYILAVIRVLRAGRSDATFANAAIVFDSCEFGTIYGQLGSFLQDAHIELHLTKIETE